MTQTIIFERPWLYPKQTEAVFDRARFSVVEASTKSGKTFGCLVWLFEQAMIGGPGQNYWWVAPVYAQAKIAYRRLKRALPKQLYRANESELSLILANGATLRFKSAERPDTLYGEDVHAVVIDEASRCLEAAWHAVRSTLTATRGPCRIIGNVKGRKNWAHHLARRAEAGTPDLAYHRITADDAVQAGILHHAEIEDARRLLPEVVFRELYLALPADDGVNPFGLTAIHACIAPLSSAPPVAWGWDLAKSVDWTVGIALDRDGVVCRFERWQGTWETTIERILTCTQRTPALVDSTGVGDPILERVQRRASGVFAGYRFTGQSRQQLMEELAVAVQRGEVRLPDGPIVRELENFEYEVTRTAVRYRAPEGLHDDCVVALALAVHHRQRHRPHHLVAPVGIPRRSPWQIEW